MDMTFRILTLTSIAFGILFTVAASSVNAQAENDSENTEAAPKNLERIEVQGQRPRMFYLSEYRKRQREFVDMFNDLVDDKDMQVVCSLESETGSRIKKRNCQPRFIDTITYEETQRELSLSGNILDAANIQERPELQKRLIREYRNFQKLTAELLNEHGELANIYVDMNDALEKYENFRK
jgi:hypothetical protein